MTKPELIIGPNTAELQRLLLQTKPEDKRLNHIQSLLLRQIEKKQFPAGPWNEEDRLYSDNCYNYATNIRTATFAQPGNGSNHPVAKPMTDDILQQAAEADGLVTLQEEPKLYGPFYIPPQHAATGHLVSLVVSPEECKCKLYVTIFRVTNFSLK